MYNIERHELQELIGRLRPESAVAQVARDLLDGGSPAGRQWNPLWDALEDERRSALDERIAAIWLLARRPLAAADRDRLTTRLRAMLATENPTWRQLLATVRACPFWIVFGPFATLVAFALLLVLMAAFADAFPNLSIVCVAILCISLPFLAAFSFAKPLVMFGRFQREYGEARRKVIDAAARAAARMQAWACLPDLLARLEDSDPAVERLAADALTALLPAMKESQYGLIPYESIQKIARIALKWDGPVSTAAIDAIALIGPPSVVPVLRQVSNTPQDPERVRKARQAIRAIEERAARHQVARTLVRAAGAPVDGATLVRPAMATPSEAAQLLRPSLDTARGEDT